MIRNITQADFNASVEKALSARELNAEADAKYLKNKAVEHFDIGLAFVKGNLALSANEGRSVPFTISSAQNNITHLLFEQFVLEVCRLYRIAEHRADKLSIPRETRNVFLRQVKPLVELRRFLEHREDPESETKRAFRRNIEMKIVEMHFFMSQPSQMILGKDEIWLGDVNLVGIRALVASLFPDQI